MNELLGRCRELASTLIDGFNNVVTDEELNDEDWQEIEKLEATYLQSKAQEDEEKVEQ